MKREIKNVTCENEACTRPLFTLHLDMRGTSVESYKTQLKAGPKTVGDMREYWAICTHCAHETKLEPDVAELVLQA